MAIPTTAVLFSGSIPAAPPGDQDCIPLSDGGSPAQIVAMVPRQATTALRGTVKPDGTTITIDADGTIHAVAATGTGGTGGGGTGGTTTSGGGYVCVTPSGATDGSNTQYTIPATVLAGTAYIYVRNGVVQPQLGANARYAIQGTQLTTSTPLQSDDWHEFYFVPGSASSETGGGGSVTPGVITGIAAWAMTEGSGLVLNDSSGHGNNATINTSGAVTWQSNSGFPGTTPLWNGSGYALASSAALTNFDGTTPFTVSAWVRMTAGGASTFIGTLNVGAAYRGWELKFEGGGGLASHSVGLFLMNTIPSNLIDVTATTGPSTQINDGLLHHIAATYDGSKTAAGVKLYRDGILLTNVVSNDTLTGTIASGLPVRFGARNDASNELTAAMAFCEIWDSVLSGSVIAAQVAFGPGLY